MFNDFIKDKKNTNKKNELRKISKEESNRVEIFPKLPSLLQLYFLQWESNSMIKFAQNIMKNEVESILPLFESKKHRKSMNLVK